jgi:phosphoglucosamine mutase
MALEELGAEVIKLGSEPDGLNINRDCGSLHPEVAAAKVRESRADIGLALDGDADRLIVVDEKGRVLDGDQIMAICALDAARRGALPGNKLVATVMSNMALEVFMRDIGGVLIRTAVGDRYVVEAMREHGAMLGGEQSGHLIFMAHNTTGDGLLAGLQLLRIVRESGKPLSQLADKLQIYPQLLINVPVKEKKPFAESAAITRELTLAEKTLGEKGRVLLRYSGTEPLARVMVEGENEDTVRSIAEGLAETLRRIV